MNIIRKNTHLVFLALLSALIILFAPRYLFSAEEFAHIFYPGGGIIHEVSFALIISFLLLNVSLLHIKIKTIVIFSFLSAFFILLIYTLILIHENNLPPRLIIFIPITSLFHATYFFMILFVPSFLVITVIRYITKIMPQFPTSKKQNHII